MKKAVRSLKRIAASKKEDESKMSLAELEDIVLSIPTQDAAFIETLASRMGWTMRRRRTSVERFINSCQKSSKMTDEEIQAEINAYRQGL